ncbi:MAG: hypothetical protein COV74_02155 [Candidatus Omnitrophica bacterium CG11_big_fil_rev_8_21_14_0_20_45_26]|uniref:DprA winged helix domain-containing protein n=1 Tax=Candidatus Abzuiibacterium crystallinum TaxID=1974748 RepID=A0A2H0LRU6_9BACT|nr:MAG: hypothetical protein COV74_02155 [Candidatus Omnitrophica bacterium CG11_big_fil_rev_8_21_14_0_20_45_26]PIW64884.1 MAG: hypothetical protein COW12_04395 [Candidatus Omnitrophica bacterium CG12_big_fil_rev_8_21_14_0_65_45_16]
MRLHNGKQSGRRCTVVTKIGLISGEILNLLDELKEPVHIKSVQCRIKAPADVVLMSLGWLVRENYVYLIPRATGVEIKLNGKH